jgi:hypothetical protein
MTTCQDPQVGWTRLERTLITARLGDVVTLETLVTETGLTPATIATVMDELTKVELFEQKEGNVFVRRRLWQPGPEPQRAG